MQAQAAIAQAFGSQASQLVGDLAQAKLEEAQDKRKQAELAHALGDNESAAQLNAQADQLQQEWGGNGTKRLAAHTAIGAPTGGTVVALGAAVGTLSSSAVADALNSAGIDGPLADSLIAWPAPSRGLPPGVRKVARRRLMKW
ncbi:MAG: hypothetical protein HLUCCA13_04330 [Halomonas sp. HL-48]|nr:hypothetical protein [Halomonas sp. HL-48]KPQ25756.1 MAG: hypothetical protein HLUCCA13_04330 [Halomonas sp. HL-48]